MTWFKVDDKLHAHPKVDATSEDERERLAAMGLWALVGSHAADYLTDGVVDRATVRRLAPKHGERLAARLVEARLWHPHERGWVFHDWADHQPLKAEVIAERERRAAAGRLGGRRSGEARASRSPKQTRSNSEAPASSLLPELPNTRPDPSRSGSDSPRPSGVAPSPDVPQESVARIKTLRTPVPDDLQPTQETIARCLQAGRPDPRPLMPDFIAWMRKECRMSGNWQDEIYLWAGRQPSFDRGRAATTPLREVQPVPATGRRWKVGEP